MGVPVSPPNAPGKQVSIPASKEFPRLNLVVSEIGGTLLYYWGAIFKGPR